MKLPVQFVGVKRYVIPYSLLSVGTMESVMANQLNNRRNSSVGSRSELSFKLPQGSANFPIGPFDIIAGDTCICVCIGDSCICNEECG